MLELDEKKKKELFPGKSNRNARVELKPIEDGGMSYWSYKTHRWIVGRYDKKNKKFIPPKKNL